MQPTSQYTITGNQITNITPIEDTSIPKYRNLIKQEIQQAFNAGNLAVRAVYMYKENNYLKQENKSPRPVYTVANKIPTKMRVMGEECTIGLINNIALFSFKRNAATFTLKDSDDLTECGSKALPDSKSLLEKQYELANRRWEVYRISTSGHLKADGSFSLPKFKSDIEINYILPHTEEIKSEYTKADIKLYCVSENDPRNIIEILTEKQKLEEELQITGKLPIGIFSETKGSISIVFEEDLNLDILQNNENIIKYCEAICSGNFSSNSRRRNKTYK